MAGPFLVQLQEPRPVDMGLSGRDKSSEHWTEKTQTDGILE
jgi:hypothetical protein